MKLRLKGDSIRLRLGPREVAQLLDAGSVADATHLAPAAALAYTLSFAPDATAVSVRFADNRLAVTVPAAVGRRWAASPDQVEVRGDQDAGGGRRLSVLIEKDFECLHGDDGATGGDDDAFPNPAQR